MLKNAQKCFIGTFSYRTVRIFVLILYQFAIKKIKVKSTVVILRCDTADSTPLHYHYHHTISSFH